MPAKKFCDRRDVHRKWRLSATTSVWKPTTSASQAENTARPSHRLTMRVAKAA